MTFTLPRLPERLRPYKFLVLLIPLFMILNYRGDEKYLADRRVVGRWEGTGRFISSTLHAQTGYMDLELTILDNLEVSGSINGYPLADTRLVRHFRVFEKDGNIVYARVEGWPDSLGGGGERFNIQLYLTSPDKIGFTEFRLGSRKGMADLKRSKLPKE
ncbi:MAG TPA: hypothetical protein P5550_00845 [Bacteroidales bacterium]|nr:hypothetical protein [Bacteroidales bacterium]